MKAKMLLMGALGILLLPILLGDWNPGHYAPKPDEESFGTWINDKSFNLGGFQKLVDTADGWKQYANISDSVPWQEGTDGQIDSKWTDSEGNIWYKAFGTITGRHVNGAKFQSLIKLSKSGTVREEVGRSPREFDSSQYPTSIDPNDPSYCIYYRAEK